MRASPTTSSCSAASSEFSYDAMSFDPLRRGSGGGRGASTSDGDSAAGSKVSPAVPKASAGRADAPAAAQWWRPYASQEQIDQVVRPGVAALEEIWLRH